MHLARVPADVANQVINTQVTPQFHHVVAT